MITARRLGVGFIKQLHGSGGDEQICFRSINAVM